MTNLSVAKRPDEAAGALPQALPAWVYNNGELTRLELERILLPSWQIVCHVNSIPKAGDYETFDLGPKASWCCATATARYAAFTMSAGIAARACWTARETAPPTITCPYHGWTYRHDGGLIGMPVRESFPGLDRAEHGLRPVRTDIAFGFVFVCLAGDPPPVSKVWGAPGRGTPALSARGDGAARAHFPGDHGRRLEDRHGQLSRVLPRAHRPSRSVPHVHAGLRRPGFGTGRRARHQLAARERVAALVRRPVSAPDRQGHRAFARRSAPLLALLQRVAEFGHRRVSRSAWISSRCCRTAPAGASFAAPCSACPTSGAKCARSAT